jgi:predicted transposase YdaD
MSRIYIKKYCNQKQIILAIKNKLLFQSNKYSAGKEVGKERRKEGRQGGRKEGRKKGSKEASKQASKQGRKEGMKLKAGFQDTC